MLHALPYRLCVLGRALDRAKAAPLVPRWAALASPKTLVAFTAGMCRVSSKNSPNPTQGEGMNPADRAERFETLDSLWLPYPNARNRDIAQTTTTDNVRHRPLLTESLIHMHASLFEGAGGWENLRHHWQTRSRRYATRVSRGERQRSLGLLVTPICMRSGI